MLKISIKYVSPIVCKASQMRWRVTWVFDQIMHEQVRDIAEF